MHLCVCVFVFKTYEKIHTLLKMLVKLQLVTTIDPVSPIYKKILEKTIKVNIFRKSAFFYSVIGYIE